MHVSPAQPLFYLAWYLRITKFIPDDNAQKTGVVPTLLAGFIFGLPKCISLVQREDVGGKKYAGALA